MSQEISWKNYWVSWLGLFTSFSTIMCCALPSLLVTLGLGASLAGFVGVFPQVVWLSEHKLYVFAISGLLISFSLLMTYWNRNAPCPIDEKQRTACLLARKWALRLGVISAVLWSIGFLFAFMLPLWF